MAYPANSVLVRDGTWQLYYDRQAATSLGGDLFWGPSSACACIEEMRPVDPRDGWLDEVCCEGGVVLDFDAQVLLWFGGQDVLHEPVLRRAHLELMRRVWDGWDVRWAYQGVEELGRYVGSDAPRVLSEQLTSKEHGFHDDEEHPEWHTTLVSVERGGGPSGLSVCSLYGQIGALEAGSGTLDFIVDRLTRGGLRLAQPPEAGIHIDTVRHELSVWAGWTQQVRQRRLEAAWPGWSVVNLRDDFEAHRSRVGTLVDWPVPDYDEERRRSIGLLRRHAHRLAKAAPGGSAERESWASNRSAAAFESPNRLDELQARLTLLRRLETSR